MLPILVDSDTEQEWKSIPLFDTIDEWRKLVTEHSPRVGVVTERPLVGLTLSQNPDRRMQQLKNRLAYYEQAAIFFGSGLHALGKMASVVSCLLYTSPSPRDS